MDKKEVKTLHEIKVSLQVKIGIVEDKKVTVGNIATAIKTIGIEPRIAEQIIQTIDKKEVETLVAVNTKEAMVKIVIKGVELLIVIRLLPLVN